MRSIAIVLRFICFKVSAVLKFILTVCIRLQTFVVIRSFNMPNEMPYAQGFCYYHLALAYAIKEGQIE